MKKLILVLSLMLGLHQSLASDFTTFEIREENRDGYTKDQYIVVEADHRVTVFALCENNKEECEEIASMSTESINQYFSEMKYTDRQYNKIRNGAIAGFSIAITGLALYASQMIGTDNIFSQLGGAIAFFGAGMEICSIGLIIATEEAGGKRVVANMLQENATSCRNREVASLNDIITGIEELEARLN